ncbi:MAG: hypothetical protein M0P26_05370 [Bacteroidales bacterium]|nr:hypothetical protein [Bacteroidales bacterium]
MTAFARYYNYEKKLIIISMEDLELKLKNSANQLMIAEYVYERFYTRFLKIFDYCDHNEAIYKIDDKEVSQNIYNTEYKSGFLQLAAGSLMIETLSAFMTGKNKTDYGTARNQFDLVFKYAEKKNNDLKVFHNTDFYNKIRCGILHQGESYGSYTITRNSNNLLIGNEINAFCFHRALKGLLQDYKNDLISENWDGEVWNACKKKIKYIIKNSKS